MSLATRRQRGQSLVEFALTLPILAVLLVGAAALGRYAYEMQIVREAVVEGSKMAVIDRPADGHAYQMTNDEILTWVRDAVHEADPAIDRMQITVPKRSAPWGFDPNSDLDPNKNASEKSFTDNFMQSVNSLSIPIHFGTCDSSPPVETLLNPGLETMRIDFQFNSGFGDNWHVPAPEVRYSFSRYEMLTIPLNFPEGGCLQHPGSD